MNKYVWAAMAFIGVFGLGVLLELSLGYNSSTQTSFGWVFRQVCVFSAAIFVWRAITKKKAPAVKAQTTVKSAAVPIKETTPPVHEPMMTPQTIEESLRLAVGNSNACPACGAENPPDAKFCESCGTAFYRNCPECGRESSVGKQYCGGCGTDMDGFLAARKILMRMEACKEEKNLLQIIEVNKGLKGDVRLPGRKGKKLRTGIEELAGKAATILKQIERLEKEIGVLYSAEAAKHSDLNGGTPAISDDRKLLKRLDEHYWLQPFFSEKLRMLEKEAKVRVAAASKIRRRRVRIAGVFVLVALIVLGLNLDSLIWPSYRSAFQKAVETRQVEKARVMAQKLGDRYDTTDGLNALKEYVAAKEQYNSMTNEISLLEKLYGGQMLAVQALVNRAESPGDPREGAKLYEQARTKLKTATQQITDMISAKESYEKLFLNKPVTVSLLVKYASQEWAAAQQSLESSKSAYAPDVATEAYCQAETLLRTAIEKTRAVPAEITIECNAATFQVFENDRPLTIDVDKKQLHLSPFMDHVLEFRARGYKTQTLMISATEPGQKITKKMILNKTAPMGGDPTAVDWEVVNDRWVKNIYANYQTTMSDKLTGRMWACYGISTEHDWREAVTYCGQFGYAGYSDWRLPDKAELGAQVSQKQLFTNVKSGYKYWSSTPGRYATSRSEWSKTARSFIEIPIWEDGAYCVDMSNGAETAEHKYRRYCVWPVRGGK